MWRIQHLLVVYRYSICIAIITTFCASSLLDKDKFNASPKISRRLESLTHHEWSSSKRGDCISSKRYILCLSKCVLFGYSEYSLIPETALSDWDYFGFWGHSLDMQSIQRMGLEYVLYQANSLQGWGREGMLRIKAHISSLKEKHSYLFVWKLPPQGLCLSSNVSW